MFNSTNMTSLRTYSIYALAKDEANNGGLISTFTFTYDNSKPASVAKIPSNDSFFSTAPVRIAGTAVDDIAGGVSLVKVYIWEDRNNNNIKNEGGGPTYDHWWNGSTWTKTETDIGVNATPDKGSPQLWEVTTNLPLANHLTN